MTAFETNDSSDASRPSGDEPSAARRPVCVRVNGREHRREVEPRLLLSDFLRVDLGLTGTHVGCEHGVCGACTILVDGEALRSCLLFAVQVDGCELTTVEGLAGARGADSGSASPDQTEGLHPLQQAFLEHHALQCGFCTPGFLMSLVPFLRDHPAPSEHEIREALSGNLCRCTGYQGLVDAVKAAAETLRESSTDQTRQTGGDRLASPMSGRSGKAQLK